MSLWFDFRKKLSNEHTSRSYISRETDVETLNLALNQNFQCLRRLTQMNGGDTEPISIDKGESKRDSDTLYRSERSPLVLSHIWGPRKFVTSGCLAAIIYTDDQLRGINFRAQIMERVVERLKLSIGVVLSNISQHDLKENAARAILWALVVGAIASDIRPCRGWFVERVVDFCDALDLQIWEEIERFAKGFLWPPAWYTQGLILWNEVEENRLMKYTMFPEASVADYSGAEGDIFEWFKIFRINQRDFAVPDRRCGGRPLQYCSVALKIS
jgi:hypothetical protein